MATANQNKDNSKANGLKASRTFWYDDFPVIRNASITFIFCILVAITMASSSQLLLDKELNQVKSAQVQKNTSRDKFQKADSEFNEIEHFQPHYLRLTQQGFIGTEQRLHWVEKIQAIQKSAALQPISYNIDEQASFLVNPSVDIAGLELHGSNMLIKMDLLHEADLLQFIEQLSANEFNDVQRCKITRLPNAQSEKLVPLLSADCTLYWITLNPKAVAADSTPTTGVQQ